MIDVDIPNQKEIALALEGLLSNKPIADDLSKELIAEKLLGLPMSDVAWTVNEAARLAVRRDKNKIGPECFEEAIERVKKSNSARHI